MKQITKIKRTKEFIETWMDAVKEGLTGEEIYEGLNFSNKGQLANRASYLRRLDIKLPRLNIGLRGRRKMIKEANEELLKLKSSL